MDKKKFEIKKWQKNLTERFQFEYMRFSDGWHRFCDWSNCFRDMNKKRGIKKISKTVAPSAKNIATYPSKPHMWHLLVKEIKNTFGRTNEEMKNFERMSDFFVRFIAVMQKYI